MGKTGDYEFNHAICLAGGSLPGLEAAAGVYDGDVLYAVSTGEVEEDPALGPVELGMVASEAAWDAVLSS